MWPFKKKIDLKSFTIHHPDYVDSIEPAFKEQGIQYYRFRAEHMMPQGRYKHIQAYLHEVGLRMDLKTLEAYLNELDGHLNGSKGVVDLVKGCMVISKMRSRISIAFEPMTAKRLATVVYFDDTESMISFDEKHAEEKIKIWEKGDSFDFFLTRPMCELLGLNDSYKTHLPDYIKTIQDLMIDVKPILDTPQAS